MYRVGPVGTLANKFIYGGAGVAAQGVLGLGEGLTSANIESIPSHNLGTASRYTGRLAGLAASTTAKVAGTVAAPVAKSAAGMIANDLTVAAKVGAKATYRTGKLGANLLTKKVAPSIDNLYTGRQFRSGAVLLGELLPAGIMIGAGMAAARQTSMYGKVYGEPGVANEIESMSYDGMGATGDLALALHKNRRG